VYDPFFATHNDPARRMAARSVHNYFFLKSVDMVRDGGIVAFITSQGVLNAEQPSAQVAAGTLRTNFCRWSKNFRVNHS